MATSFYSTIEWQKLRAQTKARWRRLNLGCALCRSPLDWHTHGATVADHIKPRRTHPELSMTPTNLWVLCRSCHNTAKQRMDAGTPVPKIGIDGWHV